MNQRALPEMVEKEAARRLAEAADGVRDQERLNCVGGAGAGDWLNALPSKAHGLHLRSREFILAVRYILGLPVLSKRLTYICFVYHIYLDPQFRFK